MHMGMFTQQREEGGVGEGASQLVSKLSQDCLFK